MHRLAFATVLMLTVCSGCATLPPREVGGAVPGEAFHAIVAAREQMATIYDELVRDGHMSREEAFCRSSLGNNEVTVDETRWEWVIYFFPDRRCFQTWGNVGPIHVTKLGFVVVGIDVEE